MEAKPQALEWILSNACNHPFRISIDNLGGETSDSERFEHAIYAQVLRYCEQGLPTRAASFRQALCEFYGTDSVLDKKLFVLEKHPRVEMEAFA